MGSRRSALLGRLACLVLVGATAGGTWAASSAGAATATLARAEAAPDGPLHTVGTAIEDARGQTVQLTGLNVTGLEGTNPQGSDVPGICNDAWKPITTAEVDQIASYGFATVRMPIAWADVEPRAPRPGSGGSLTHAWNTAYLDVVRADVARFARHHIRVILDMHQSTWSTAFTTPATATRPGCPGSGMPEWLNPDAAGETFNQARCAFLADRTEPEVPGTDWGDFEAAWREVAEHVAAANSNVVGFDVLNEPTCEHVGLNGFFGALAPALHADDPHALVILEDKQDPGTYELTRLPKVPNLVLSIHLHEDYWTQPSPGQAALPYSASSVLAANVARARDLDVPLYVGEFYAFDANGVQPTHQRDANYVGDIKDFTTYAAQHDVSWTFWAWIQQRRFTNQTALAGGVGEALAGRIAVR